MSTSIKKISFFIFDTKVMCKIEYTFSYFELWQIPLKFEAPKRSCS